MNFEIEYIKANNQYFYPVGKKVQDECDWYERKPDGSAGAVSGKKDDLVVVSAGSVWLANKYLDPPALIPYVEPGERRRTTGKTIISEASM